MTAAGLLLDLEALLAPYGGPGGFWRLCVDRPDVAEAALAVAGAGGASDPDIATLTALVEAQRAAGGANVAFTFIYDDTGRVEHAVPGAWAN